MRSFHMYAWQKTFLVYVLQCNNKKKKKAWELDIKCQLLTYRMYMEIFIQSDNDNELQ